MKRETRPFVVEIRRGSKKQTAPFLPPAPEAQPVEKGSVQRAEEILFSREPEQDKPAQPRTGRILESVEPSAAPPADEASPEPEPVRRRGRPPGSKNRGPGEGESERSGRGRPRSGPQVRRLKLTPELVNAAMETMTKVASSAPAAAGSAGGERDSEETVAAGARRRARPPKEASAAGSAEQGQFTFQYEDELADDAIEEGAPARAAGRSSRQRLREDLRNLDVRRLYKPGERWKGHMRLRALARRSRGR